MELLLGFLLNMAHILANLSDIPISASECWHLDNFSFLFFDFLPLTSSPLPPDMKL